MKWVFKKERLSAVDPQELPTALAACQEKNEFFLACIQALLRCIQDFTLDIKELQSDILKKKLITLEGAFGSNQKLKIVRSSFRKNQTRIRRFIDRQKQYLTEREKELKDIIDLLAKAMVTLDTDNRQFNQTIYQQSEKIEQITRLDDIKRIKQALIHEIDHIRETVQDKQNRDVKQLKMLSKQVSTLNRELQKAKVDSVTDGLTGVPNRKALDRHLDRLVNQNSETRGAFTILMVDIDDFKAINDVYGHPTGDRVLLAVAQQCQRLIRNNDFIARYGGEEFIIVLPNASLPHAAKKAQRICNAIASKRYSLEDVKVGHILAISVSIGISAFRKGDTAQTLIGRADQALYIAKHSGKNRVMSENDLVTAAAANSV